MKRTLKFTHYETTVGKGKRKEAKRLVAREGDIIAARAEAVAQGGHRVTPRYSR